jgi:hypothetical protein
MWWVELLKAAFWPLAVTVLGIVYRKPITTVFSALRKVKAGGFEFETEKLGEFLKQQEPLGLLPAADGAVPVTPTKPAQFVTTLAGSRSIDDINAQIFRGWQLAQDFVIATGEVLGDRKAGVMAAWKILDRVVREAAAMHNIPSAPSELPEELAESLAKVVPGYPTFKPSLREIIAIIRYMRDAVLELPTTDADEAQAYSFELTSMCSLFAHRILDAAYFGRKANPPSSPPPPEPHDP